MKKKEELSVWLRCNDFSFPAEWGDYLRALHINRARTRSTGLGPEYAIEGQGYVVWVSDPRLVWVSDLRLKYWRVSLAISASAPAAGLTLLEDIARSVPEGFPLIQLEKALGPDDGTTG